MFSLLLFVNFMWYGVQQKLRDEWIFGGLSLLSQHGRHLFCQGDKTSEQTAGGGMLQRPQPMPQLAYSITKGLHHQRSPSPRCRASWPQEGASERSCLPHTSQEAESRKIKGRLGTRCSPQKHDFISRWVSDPDFPLCLSLLHWPVLWVQ